MADVYIVRIDGSPHSPDEEFILGRIDKEPEDDWLAQQLDRRHLDVPKPRVWRELIVMDGGAALVLELFLRVVRLATTDDIENAMRDANDDGREELRRIVHDGVPPLPCS